MEKFISLVSANIKCIERWFSLREGSDILRKSKEEMRLSERILAAIPGFKGYKEKELRRESDRLIRDHIYRRLRESEDVLKKSVQKLSDDRSYGLMENVDRLVMQFDRLKARVDHASYGYSGFFDVVKIDERDLDEMLSFDQNLVDAAEKLSEEVKTLRVVKPEEVANSFNSIGNSLTSLEETFNEREEKIMGVK